MISLENRREQAILKRIAQHRDMAALEEFYALYRPRVCRFLARFTQDDTIIEDAYNEIMFIIWEKAGQFRGNSKVSSWVFTIAHRQCLSLVKKSNAWAEPPAGEQDEELEGTYNPIATLEQADLIQGCLNGLPEEQRMVLELNYVAGFTLEEIADITGNSVNTVKSRLRYARRKMRENLDALESVDTTKAQKIEQRDSQSGTNTAFIKARNDE